MGKLFAVALATDEGVPTTEGVAMEDATCDTDVEADENEDESSSCSLVREEEKVDACGVSTSALDERIH